MTQQPATEVLDYYENLARSYDKERFGNSYGAYIHRQEYQTLRKIASDHESKLALDMACGTGRLMEFANYGIDISGNMIAEARKKFPQKAFFIESAFNTHFPDGSFDLIISFHLLMHLKKEETFLLLNEANRLLKKGGQLVIDFPSKKRRRLTGNKIQGWQGANDFSIEELRAVCKEHWHIAGYYGILFFPIHRINESFRTRLLVLDSFLCTSFLKEFSSYMIVVMNKI